MIRSRRGSSNLTVVLFVSFTCLSVPFTIGRAAVRGQARGGFSNPCWPPGPEVLAAVLSADGRFVAGLVLTPSSSSSSLPAELEVRIWNADTLNVVRSRPLGVVESSKRVCVWIGGGIGPPFTRFLEYAKGDVLLVAYDEAGSVHVLRSSDLEELARIEVELPAARPVYAPQAMVVSPGGERIAVLLSGWCGQFGTGPQTSQDFSGAEVRIYDIGTRQIVWRSAFAGVLAAAAAWDPGGRRLAVTLFCGNGVGVPARDADNLLILESASGNKLKGIRTGDLAGPVCFGPNDEVFTAPYHFRPERHDAPFHQRVKVWNPETGELKREIAYPGRDVHNFLALSEGGGVLLGYVGKEGPGWDLERTVHILDQRLAAWDARTGAPLWISPRLDPQWQDTILHSLALSGDASRALAYVPGCSGLPMPKVFDLPEIPEARRK